MTSFSPLGQTLNISEFLHILCIISFVLKGKSPQATKNGFGLRAMRFGNTIGPLTPLCCKNINFCNVLITGEAYVIPPKTVIKIFP